MTQVFSGDGGRGGVGSWGRGVLGLWGRVFVGLWGCGVGCSWGRVFVCSWVRGIGRSGVVNCRTITLSKNITPLRATKQPQEPTNT
jgi:hypothetical protein